MELPAGTPVGVVGSTCMENLSRSIEGAGLDHLNVLQVYVDEEPEEVLATLASVRGHRDARQDATPTTPNCAGNRLDACLEDG
jgi:hypothetical protein